MVEHITPKGQAALQAELKQLWEEERPKVVDVVSWAAGNGDRSENGDYIYGKKRLREIDRRVRYLRKRLEAVEVFDPALQPRKDKIFFGARVTFLREDDREQTVTLVGKDEIDAAPGNISLTSPVGRALIGKEVGDDVLFKAPGGEQEIEVLVISYPKKGHDPY